jgi:competence protein ComEC
VTPVADDSGAPLDLRLVPAALTCWAVTAAGIRWHWVGSVVAATAAVAAVAAVGHLARRCRDDDRPRLGAIVSAVAVVGAAFTIAVGLRVEALHDHPITGRYGSVAAVVVMPSESPRPAGGSRAMFRATLRSVDGDESTGRVTVFGSADRFAGVAAGRPVGIRARIGRPGRHDLSVAVLSASGAPTWGEAAPVHRAAQRVRTGFIAAARDALPPDQAVMLPALVLGDTSALPAPARAEFRRSGLTHLTAVSGANVTIVCGAVLLTAGLVGPRLATLLAAVALLAFVIVVEPSASVLRAAVMGAVTLLAMVTHRRRQALPALSTAVLVLLLAAPELAVDVGFALSVAATAALVVIAPVWSRRLVDRGWPKPLSDALAVAAAAQLVTAPLVAGISGTVSLVAVLANLAVAPVIPPITVAGTAAAALQPLWPAGAELLIRFTGPELWWLSRVAHWTASVPGAALAVPGGPAGVAVVAVFGAVAVLSRRRPRLRWVTVAALVTVLAWTVSGPSVGHDTIMG